ncbi:MAG: imidazolonepropionase [Phaeodactylibacter sp.]|nr:imidazolonepropionase [Phaeodactylibacter sp.]MCB0614984.1 imidazolonepropionase [Phaeodactylibacter sp.]MCB9302275.1 imidazolonepropionase [Lewinellaceae bacterium]HQU60083.1 imidazolonepropionase [Saprospiraceae bacterium]
MPSLLIRNIHTLVQAETSPRPFVAGLAMQELPVLENAYLLVQNGRFHAFGPMDACPERADEVIEAAGRMVFPTWCDSHTHLVFAASRETEFVDRIKGLSYEEIARRGGGILNSARRLRETPEEVLLQSAYERLLEIQGFGTGAVEIKSGYGLTVDSELKMLRVIQQLKGLTEMPIRATFLGAHALPLEYRDNRNSYIQLIIDEMLPRIAAEGLADYIDAFCEKGFFSVEETARLIEAGAQYGLKAKVHTNQFNCLGGIQACVAGGAISADHLEVVNDEEVECLLGSHTMPTLLPSAPFFIGGHYQPARKLIDAGLPVALATDYNPGTTPSGRMQFVLSLACIKCRMTPEEAINAATLNGARAMELEATHGSIAVGKTASFFLSKPMPSIAYLPYAFGDDLVAATYINGKLVANKR